jgi:hypothetical protein
MKSHHPGHYNGAVASHLRDYFPAVEASTDIPEDQRAWTCAFCPKALPQLNRSMLPGPKTRTDDKVGLGDKLRAFAAKKSGDNLGGHEVVGVAVTWKTWPSPIKDRNPSFKTCKWCRVLLRSQGGKRLRVACQGLREKAHWAIA